MRAHFVLGCLKGGAARLVLILAVILLLCQASLWLAHSPVGVATSGDGDSVPSAANNVVDLLSGIATGRELRAMDGTDGEELSVLALVAGRALQSSWVLALAMLAILCFGIPLGILRGKSRSNPFAWLLALPSAVGVCVPVFWIATLVGWWMLDRQGIPLPGAQTAELGVTVGGGAPWMVERWPGFVLAAIIAVTGTGWLVRSVSGGIQHSAMADHLWVGRMRGMRESQLFHRHTLRNSLRPIVMSVSNLLPFLIGASILGEGVLDFPGLGGLVYQAGLAGDFSVLLAATFFIAVAVLVARVAGGIVLGLMDPQVREVGALP
jgi:ABC-type dipeptide/oligopeptide/nickel transport system permease component